MSYQIKSTPYFQRILTKSKQNGQLQMLKEEYERINVINEHKIERRMREVRLNRLKREIEEINSLSSKRRRLDLKERPKTKEAERLENIKRARYLGQYFSERNMSDQQAAAKRETKPPVVQKRSENVESFASKRIKYGNEMSNFNMQKINLSNLRKEFNCNGKNILTNANIINPNIDVENISKPYCREEKMEKNCSHSKYSKFNTNNTMCNETCHGLDLQKNRNGINHSSVLTLSENVHFIDLETIDNSTNSENSDQMFDAVLSLSPSKTNRATKYWGKLATSVRRHIKMHRSNEVYNQSNNQTSLLAIPSSVSNGMNSQKKCDISNESELNIDNEFQNETYNNNEYSVKTPDEEDFLRFSSVQPISNSIFSQTASSKTNVNPKDNLKFNVEKLCRIFEHQK